MTIYRRRQEFGLLDEPVPIITDRELEEIVQHLQTELPNMGESLVWGRLRSMGHYVTRARLRQAIRNTDPLSAALRWGGGLASRRR